MELSNEYLSKFKLIYNDTLFPPVWSALKEKRCPLCNSLLKVNLKKTLMYCKAKKCVGFKITPRTYRKLTTK